MNNDFYLYQYTNLETLALILKTRKIKFTKLSLLDDPLEKYVGFMSFTDKGPRIERANLGGFCFVSCWTKKQEESIAMWDMYGDRKRGVRIGLPVQMMDTDYCIYQTQPKSRLVSFPRSNYPIPELVEIDYTRINDPLINDGRRAKILIDNLGKYKLSDWSFQQEYRFRLFATNDKNFKGNRYFTSDQMHRGISVSFNSPISKNNLFFKLNDEALSQIRLVVGPNMSDGAKVLFELLVNSYSIDKKQVSVSKFCE